MFELSLAIGNSLSLKKNANDFFSILLNKKTIAYITLWQRNDDTLNLLASYPKVKNEDEEIDNSSPICKELALLHKNTLVTMEQKDFCISGFQADKIWAYFSDDLYLIFIRPAEAPLFNKEDLDQLKILFKKFIISAKACLSHKMLLDEVVKRKEAENRLYERESYYRFGANSLTEGIIATDLEDKITYVNRAMTAITGYTKDEMMGEVAHLLFKPVGIKDFLNDVIEAKRKQDISEVYEIQQLHKKGGAYWVRINASAFKDIKGTIVGSIATMLDITESVKVQAAIAKSEGDLQNLLESMFDGLLVLDANGTILSANKSCRTLFEIEESEMGNINLEQLVHPDEKKKVQINRLKVMKHGRLSRFVSKIITRKGNAKIVEVTSSAIVENGVYLGSRDIIRNITQATELEDLREQSEQKLRLIIDTALDAVISMDSNAKVTEWNKNAERIFGFSYAEVIGKELSTLIIPHKYRDAHNAGMRHYAKTKEGPVLNQRIEISAINKAGEEFPIELAITPVKQEGKTFFSAFLRDITERKAIESQREVLLAELESVNQELRDFAYIVSHDLKAPLRSIGSISDWLMQDYEQQLDDEGKELLRLLKARITRMHGLIEGVLQYSKVGRLQNAKEDVNVEQLLHEIIDLLAPEKCKITLPENLPIINYDRVRLHQVFQNLISNAIKFMDKPDSEINILCEENDTHYAFTIKDNGMGIEKSHFEKIFQIFQTLRSKDDFESTGIGLSIVKRIVELNKGTISVKSEIGRGSEFTFTVPKN
jgi:two-component system sensor kinase FixL